ncbi:MAG: hypothetical protein N3F07_02235 [Candidatus Micrarchaeota archaeon]|nr:hypothetical protein [Candidatus Micrarchaeota archaeon]
MEEEDGQNAANSELRFITLELMKLAQKSGKSFEEVALEYLRNTCLLQELIANGQESRETKIGHTAAASKRK